MKIFFNHHIFGRSNETKDYDRQYFQSIICPMGTRHANGRMDHYSSGEKYCSRDEVFLRVSVDIIHCPKCGCQLRSSNARSNSRLRKKHEELFPVIRY